MLHGVPNGCSGYVEYSKLVQSMLFYGYLILYLQFRGVVKPSSSLLSRIPNQNSIMPHKFLLGPRFEKVQTFENSFWMFLELCLQDAFKMNRDALAVSMWWFFDFISGTPDSDHPETPEKEVGSSQRKPSTEWFLQAGSFGMFWLYFLVAVSWRQDERRIGTSWNHSEVPYTSYKITRSYEILRVSEYLLTGLQRFADCRCSPKLVGWCNMVQTLFYL